MRQTPRWGSARWAWALQWAPHKHWRLQVRPQLQQRSIDISVSYSGTLAVSILFVYSSVASVVFTLVECSSYSGPDAVVFIDGTVP